MTFKIFKTEPYKKQREIFDASKDKENAALFMEMGTGKTKVAIDTATHLWLENKIDAVLILAPKGVYLNWIRNELPKHMAAPYKAAFWSSTATSKEKAWLKKMEDPAYVVGGLKIICVNTEAISHDAGEDFCVAFAKKHRCLGIVDESTSLKNPSSITSKAAERIGRHIVYKRIMTGTPITKNPLDLFGQIRFLNKDLLGAPSFAVFRAIYADIVNLHGPGGRLYPKVVGFRRLDQLQKLLDSFAFRALKIDCFDLPPKTYQRVYFTLSPEQKKHYDAIKDNFLTVMEDGNPATVQLALVQMMRMHQVACGHLKLDNGETVLLKSSRISTLLAVLDEAPDKVIIWCKYKQDIEDVCQALEKYKPGSVAEYHGSVDQKGRAEALQEFQKGDKNYLVGTAHVGGRGLTLIEASTNVFYSYDYDREKRAQAEDRNHRFGQTKNVTIVEIAAKDTIDEIILDCHRDKKSLADMILDNGPRIFSMGNGQKVSLD